MAIAPGGDKPDLLITAPDRLIAAGISVGGVDFQRYNQLCGAIAVALAGGGFATNEFALVPGDPAVHPGPPGRVALG